MSKGVPFASGTISTGLSHAQLCQLLEWIHRMPQLAALAELNAFLQQLNQTPNVQSLWIIHGSASQQGWQQPPHTLGHAAACHRHDWQRLPEGLGPAVQFSWLSHTQPATACLALLREGQASVLYVQPCQPEDSAVLRMLGGLLPHLHPALQRLLPPAGGHNPLSAREKDIFHWMMHGKTNWEIATILDISERTVKFHAANIIRKLDANNRTHAIVLGLQKGLASHAGSA